jgi:hypothetical protein
MKTEGSFTNSTGLDGRRITRPSETPKRTGEEASISKEGRTARTEKPPTDNPKDGPRDGEQTPFERFEDFVKKLAAVPKAELDEKRAEYEREKKERRKRAG